jgi:hypothetical protein
MTPEWDDARLDTAFAARAAATTRSTAELTARTVERIRTPRSAPRPVLRFAAWGGVAAAIAVGIVVAIGVGFRDRGLLASVPPNAATATGAIPSANPTGGPSDAEVLTVATAIGVRDSLSQPAEIRVRGWVRGGVPVPCPFPGPGRNPARLDCPPAVPWIVGDLSDAGPGVLNVDPVGPAFRPSFALVEADALLTATAGEPPIEIILTGHFHDRRAALCEVPACDATFVVDRIDSLAGVAQPIDSFDLAVSAEKRNTTTGIEIPPRGPADQFDGAIAASGGEITIISHRTMSIEGLLRAEPGLTADWPGVGTATVVTSISAVQTQGYPPTAVPRTFLVPDGSAFVYQVTAQGPVRVIGLPVEASPVGLRDRIGGPISVTDAIDRRDNSLDDTELLVRGFAWAPPPLSCPDVLPSQPVLDQCPSTFTWLAQSAPPQANGNELLRPTGAAINLVIPPESANLAPLTTTPRNVAVLGHFDDHRSATCPEGATERCRRNFIVDAILDPEHLALDPDLALSVHPGPSNIPRGNAAWAASVAGLTDADRADRLISAFPVAVAALSAFEPDTLDTQAVAEVETVWLVHFLDIGPGAHPVVRTRIVTDARPGDGSARVYDLTADGVMGALAAAP